MNNFLDELKWRGLIYQTTPGIEKAFAKGATIYWGIDPTADSLHLGHLLGILILKRAESAGNKIILLAGGGTSLIGDPSGKDEERPIISKEVIEKNKEKLKKQFGQLLSSDNVILVDNTDWLEKLTYIEFLRDVGKHMSVNSMLDKESVSSRIGRETGISYAEFSYQLLQAYDFMVLYQKHQCEVQVGGSDQWGNMIQGVELIRKKLGKVAHVLSYPLIVNPKTGKKFGKTEAGEAIWLDPYKTHPFAFYQFLINVDDHLAPILIRYYSFKSKEEIEKIEKEWQLNKESRLIQKELAYELTVLIHGVEVAELAKKITEILFSKETDKLTQEDLEFVKNAIPYKTISSEKEFNLEQILPELGLVNSKSEARRLITQNGVKVEKMFEKYYLIRKGKREYGLVEIVS